MWRLFSGASDRPICYHAAAMSLMPPTLIRLVPGLLRSRGLKVSFEKIRTALESGAIPGHHERYRWVLTSEDVDAAESYFREIAIIGANKGGAAAVRQAKVRQRASETP
jgi:hypothetical protein